MRLRPRVLVGFLVAALAVGSCSSDTADVPVTAATIATAPTTSTRTAPGITPPAGVPTSAVTTTAVATSAAPAGAVTTTTVTTSAVTTAASTTRAVNNTDPATTAAPTTAVPAAPADYAPVAGPSVGGETNAIDPSWLGADGVTLTTVADGTYWATLAGEGDTPQPFVNFKLTQAFFGAACTAKFGDASCDNDLATLETPTGAFPLYLATARLTVADAVTQRSFQVTNDELFGLVGGKPPGAAAPAGFTYVPFAFLLTVQGGQIVAAEQVWTP